VSIKVVLPTAFTRHTDGRKQFDSESQNLPALLSEFDQTFPALSTQIKDEQGRLRKFINIYINDEDIRFLGGDSYAFQDGDEIMLIPSIAGGGVQAGLSVVRTSKEAPYIGTPFDTHQPFKIDD
jgi:sulfur-carrier protein